ncbi:MAG: precorrin-8X methylmutase [Clostridia bacterium]|nr:precorrin-8X methylmutase [Clostridia bacterium]
MYTSLISPNAERVRSKRKPQAAAAYQSESALRIINRVELETGDMSLRPSLHFTPGVVDRIERQLALGCSVIVDSNLIYTGLNRELAAGLPVQMECFMDDPRVVSLAAQKRITRAEVAIEQALSVKGPKLIVIGSAPMALNRLLQLNQHSPLHEVVIIAAATGFASIVELKEQLWESGLPCIVMRGRRGGAGAAIAVANALLADAAAHQP